MISKEKARRVRDDIAEAMDSFVRDAREKGRDLDDRFDAWADENAHAIGGDEEKTSGWIKIGVYFGAAVILFALIAWAVS